MVWVCERHFGLIRTGADFEGFIPDCPVGVGVFVAILGIDQVVDPGVEVPVTSDVVKGVILHHQVYDMFDLVVSVSSCFESVISQRISYISFDLVPSSTSFLRRSRANSSQGRDGRHSKGRLHCVSFLIVYSGVSVRLVLMQSYIFDIYRDANRHGSRMNPFLFLILYIWISVNLRCYEKPTR